MMSNAYAKLVFSFSMSVQSVGDACLRVTKHNMSGCIKGCLGGIKICLYATTCLQSEGEVILEVRKHIAFHPWRSTSSVAKALIGCRMTLLPTFKHLS